MIISSGSFAKALTPEVSTWYGDAYGEHAVEYTEIFKSETSTRAFEEDVSITGMGLASVQNEGSPIIYDYMQQGFINRYTHVTYGKGFIITRNMVEDDLYDVVGKRKSRALAFSMRQTKEVVGANVLNRAFSASYLFGDGLELCSLLHVNVSGGTWANELATAADLSEVALEQACTDIGNFTNDRGLKINIMPQKLIIPNGLQWEAARILKSAQQSGTNYNDINALKNLNSIPQGFAVNHYLTDTDAWFIITNCPDGMKYKERRADDFGSENDFDTDNAKFKATGRYAFGNSDPRGIFGSPGS